MKRDLVLIHDIGKGSQQDWALRGVFADLLSGK
jgi:hypothetical protein